MKLIRRIVGVLFLAMVLVAPGPAQADTAPGWYMATPSWDRQLQCDTQATCPRFLVLSDWIDASNPSGGAAVMDRETGLVWETSPSLSTFQWEAAQIHCNQLAVGNRLGWRLPTIQDLASLVDPTVPSPGPMLPAGHPFTNVQSGAPYWSATSAPGFAWSVVFSSGGVNFGYKFFSHFTWCVRGGHGVDPQ